MNNQQPAIGRIVHYTNLGDADGRFPPEQQAAIITRVDDVQEMRVSLKVLYTTGLFDLKDVPFSGEYARGHWTWPKKI